MIVVIVVVLVSFGVWISVIVKKDTPASTNISQPKEITWEEAKSLIEDCQVKTAFESHQLIVSFDLKDGTRIKTIEPTLRSVLDEQRKVSDKCGWFSVGTE